MAQGEAHLGKDHKVLHMGLQHDLDLRRALAGQAVEKPQRLYSGPVERHLNQRQEGLLVAQSLRHVTR